MLLKPFALERYFAKYEFSAKYLLCSSDCDGISLQNLLENSDEEMRILWENLHLGYTESQGHPLLKQEIVKLYEGITKEDVLIVVPEEGIFLALNSILNKGDHMICTFPGYQSLYEIAEGLECEVTKWLPNEKDGWRFDPKFLRNSIKPNTKLIVFNFPHNPTGYLPSKEDFEEIIKIARQHNVYILSDEMYRYLEINESDRLPAACEIYEKAISLFGMSKTFGMAGVRIGWVITKDKEMFKRMATFKDYTTICNSAPSELLSIMALRCRNQIVSNNLARINKNISLLRSFFNKHSMLFQWVEPKAGTIAFPRLAPNVSAYDFCEQVVKNTGIMLLPSSVYETDDNHIRIGFGRENMPSVLEILSKYITKEFK